MDIYYDVSASVPPLTVAVQVSADGGATFAVNAVSLTGDVGGGLQPGSNRHVVWNAGGGLERAVLLAGEVQSHRAGLSLASLPARRGSYFASVDAEMRFGNDAAWCSHGLRIISLTLVPKAEQLDATFRFRAGALRPNAQAAGECALEFILRKLPAEEIARAGRFPAPAP